MRWHGFSAHGATRHAAAAVNVVVGVDDGLPRPCVRHTQAISMAWDGREIAHDQRALAIGRPTQECNNGLPGIFV